MWPRDNWQDKEQRGEKPLLLVATDGELYGHHHALKELFLKYLWEQAAQRAGFELIYPSLYLRRHPPRDEMGIQERSSWSCEHGVERWSRGCSCTEGDSSWKWAFRKALNSLATEIDALTERELRPLLRDVWRSRDRYIWVWLGETVAQDYLSQAALRTLTTDEEERVMRLMEAQYWRQCMFTSCPFFWQDPSRLESQHNMACASRAIDLVRQAVGVSLEPLFRSGLSRVLSHQTGQTGEQIYKRLLHEQLGPMARAA